MAKILVLPKLSMMMSEGTIINWYFKEGDHVKAGDVLYDVESGKTGGSAESEDEGTILKIVAEVGTKLKCGEPVAIIGAEGEDITDIHIESTEDSNENEIKTKITVIGGGPGGYVAAIRAAQLGADVTLVEKEHIGGTCLNEGCIPTKALLHSAELFDEIKNGASAGVIAEPTLDFVKVMENKNAVVNRLVGGVQALLRANGVKVVDGEASFIDKNTINVKKSDGEEKITSDKFIIATGSVPSVVPIEGIDGKHCIDSTGALSLESIPESMAVIGGGVIGVEMATVYSSFGTKVTIVEMLPRLLMNMDEDSAAEVEKSLKKAGVEIMTSAKVLSIEHGEKTAVLTVEKDGEIKLEAEKVLVCIGRKPNTAVLNPEIAGVKTERGAVKVNDHMETNISTIYAIGDCTGGIMLAHVASVQGETAAENAMGMDTRFDIKSNPSCVYTRPEIAEVGYTEEKAKNDGIDYAAGVFSLAGNGKSIIMNGGEGFVKVIIHSRTKKILGMQIVGPRATDLIAEGALAVSNNLGIEDIIKTIHAHPTVSEAVREAALAADGRAIHG